MKYETERLMKAQIYDDNNTIIELRAEVERLTDENAKLKDLMERAGKVITAAENMQKITRLALGNLEATMIEVMK